jgi:hypothetical protein
MSASTATDTGRTSSQLAPGRDVPAAAWNEYRELWTMSRAERVAAMWRGELTIRQLCQWSSRAQHEVPLLGGELAWIAMRTPEWAEASHKLGADRVPAHYHQEANR